MSPRCLLRFLLLLLVVIGHAAEPPKKLLPGVTYYDGPEKLTGKLTFLLRRDARLETNTDSTASIYEFETKQEIAGQAESR